MFKFHPKATGRKIRARRREVGMTVPQAAEALGMCKTSYYMLERAEKELTIKDLVNLANIYDTRPGYLLKIEEVGVYH